MYDKSGVRSRSFFVVAQKLGAKPLHEQLRLAMALQPNFSLSTILVRVHKGIISDPPSLAPLNNIKRLQSYGGIVPAIFLSLWTGTK